jgi:hypothetical protein
MLGGLDLIVSLGGLLIAPAFDFIKKKFIKSENDTPERTIGTLATTKPEAVEGYIKGYAELLKAKVDFFNRDVIGTPSQWVVNIRAVIRPVGVCLSFIILITIAILTLLGRMDIESATILGIRLSCEAMISSWFGDRISLSGK